MTGNKDPRVSLVPPKSLLKKLIKYSIWAPASYNKHLERKPASNTSVSRHSHDQIEEAEQLLPKQSSMPCFNRQRILGFWKFRMLLKSVC